ncbi:hypothetical protein DAI22_11g135800 [Oryza sativa Japonica Group]|nr:hypothetical protein DAI22_11g135800 [Oryza sativa Japonica Group]
MQVNTAYKHFEHEKKKRKTASTGERKEVVVAVADRAAPEPHRRASLPPRSSRRTKPHSTGSGKPSRQRDRGRGRWRGRRSSPRPCHRCRPVAAASPDDSSRRHRRTPRRPPPVVVARPPPITVTTCASHHHHCRSRCHHLREPPSPVYGEGGEDAGGWIWRKEMRAVAAAGVSRAEEEGRVVAVAGVGANRRRSETGGD